jgi:hypothetical protein
MNTQWADESAIPETKPAPPKQGDEPPPMPPPKVFAIGELETPPRDDPNELLRHRYLCRGGGLLLAGPTGIGKSTLAMQAALCWSVGRECFGIVPAAPLTSLFVQAENDGGDLAEMRDGILGGLGFSDRERRNACERVLVATEDTRSGAALCAEVIAPLLEEHVPNLLWIDPALAYLGGEANSQKDVGAFLRNGINPLVHKHGCGVIVLHHTNKPPSGAEKPDWRAGDFAYLGSGSSEWANWPRAVLALRSVGSHEIFELRAGKRGGRLRWRDPDTGERLYARLIAHAKNDGFHWRVGDPAELDGGKKGRPPKFTTKDLLAILAMAPKKLKSTEWQRLAKDDRNISKTVFYELLRELTDSGTIEKDPEERWSVKSGKSGMDFTDR